MKSNIKMTITKKMERMMKRISAKTSFFAMTAIATLFNLNAAPATDAISIKNDNYNMPDQEALKSVYNPV